MRRRDAIGVGLAFLLAAGCTKTLTTCGQPREGGGPPVLLTREDDVCEVVRWRVLQHLRDRAELSPYQADVLYRASEGWAAATSLDDLRRRIDADGTEALLATQVVDTARSAWHDSRKPPQPGCTDDEECVARAAARGARFALRRRYAYVTATAEQTERERRRDEALERLAD